MDLQNVSSLVIPEGGVRTIHDKNSRLLWGKLSYDTKYAGNTIQDGSPTPDAPVPIQTVTGTQTVTVCGKNWFNKKATPTFRYHGTCTEIDTGVRVTCVSSTSYSYALFVFDVSSYIGKTITLSANVSVSASNIPRIAIGICDASGGNRTQKVQNTNTGQVSVSYTIASSDHYIFANFSSNAGGTAVTGDYADYKNAQLEIGPATAYEPYQSHDYTVDLGTTELCKIGDYQDYIYKSGNDWYVHKECGKSELGSLTWGHTGTNQTGIYRKSSDDLKLLMNSSANNIVFSGVCTHFTATRADSAGTYGANQGVSVNVSGNLLIYYDVYNTNSSSDDISFKTWLQDNNVVLYYTLITPTVTKITDNTLIEQLNAIHYWLTRYGYTATVTGNLPIIINQTTLN